jgi:hypothetical protein
MFGQDHARQVRYTLGTGDLRAVSKILRFSHLPETTKILSRTCSCELFSWKHDRYQGSELVKEVATGPAGCRGCQEKPDGRIARPGPTFFN